MVTDAETEAENTSASRDDVEAATGQVDREQRNAGNYHVLYSNYYALHDYSKYITLLFCIYLFICTVIKMASHNKTYMQDNKATSAALTGALYIG